MNENERMQIDGQGVLEKRENVVSNSKGKEMDSGTRAQVKTERKEGRDREESDG